MKSTEPWSDDYYTFKLPCSLSALNPLRLPVTLAIARFWDESHELCKQNDCSDRCIAGIDRFPSRSQQGASLVLGARNQEALAETVAACAKQEERDRRSNGCDSNLKPASS